MSDTTETIRRASSSRSTPMLVTVNSFEEKHGQVWDTQELQHDFEVLQFAAADRGQAEDHRSDGQSLLSAQPEVLLGFSATLMMVWSKT